MSYRSIRSPRFLINVLDFLDNVGYSKMDPINSTSPASINKMNGLWPEEDGYDPMHYITASFPNGIFTEKSFAAFLGHSTEAEQGTLIIEPDSYTDTIVVNANKYSGNDSHIKPLYKGFTIQSFNGLEADYGQSGELVIETYADFACNCVIVGTYYDMPNAPNLSLTMSREYEMVKEITTYNGSSISNSMGNGAPKWGELAPWELDRYVYGASESLEIKDKSLSRSGRKTWNLKWSFMDDSDLWGSNQSLSVYSTEHDDSDTFGVEGDYKPIYTDTGYDSEDIHTATGISVGFNYNLLTGDNFFSQVWHRTLGGTLPFIFQPDSNNQNPDQFTICRFKNNSLKVTQSAFNVYDISLSIEETW
jgi:hypothetical protein